MKMELIAALLHQPQLLLLDEPTIGLDVVAQFTIQKCLKEYNTARGVTMLLTSHYMADIQELCRRVVIIDHGSIFFDGKLSEVIDRFADFKLITFQTDSGSAVDRAMLDECGEVTDQTPGQIKLKVKRERVIPVCKRLLDVLPITDIDIQEVPIEDIIRQLFAREKSIP